MNKFGASLAQRDASQAATVNNLAASLGQIQALHQQTSQTVAQLAQGVGESIGHLVSATATALSQRDAAQAAALNASAASIAQLDGSHQQLSQAVAQLAKGIGESIGHMASAMATALAQRDTSHAAAMNRSASSLAKLEALHEQINEGVAQLAQGVGDSFGHMASASATTSAQLEQRVKALEVAVEDLQNRMKGLEQA